MANVVIVSEDVDVDVDVDVVDADVALIVVVLVIMVSQGRCAGLFQNFQDSIRKENGVDSCHNVRVLQEFQG